MIGSPSVHWSQSKRAIIRVMSVGPTHKIVEFIVIMQQGRWGRSWHVAGQPLSEFIHKREFFYLGLLPALAPVADLTFDKALGPA